MNRSPALTMNAEQRTTLEQWLRRGTTPQRVVFRARIVLRAADGIPSKYIATELDTSQDTVRLWRRRFATGGVAALIEDAPRTGRPRQITAAQEQRVVEATLHTTPAGATHWSLRRMAAQHDLSAASIHRIWQSHRLKPHQTRTFKLSQDPQFVDKLVDVVGLYMNPPEKALLFCVDEKSQIQALQRSQPGLPMKPGRAGTFTHDYKRHGTTTLFAALSVLEGTVITSCMPRHRHQEFRRFLALMDAQTPADVDLHLVVDNYATHGHPAIQRWLRRHPRFHLHFIPTSSSWLNLVEIWFAHLTTQQIRRGDFLSVPDLIDAINAYVHHHNQRAQPFVWTAPAERILERVAKCRAISESLH